MRDTLPQYLFNIECGIVNLNTSHQSGSQWVCYYRNKYDRFYFDSYEQITPMEIQHYLKTGIEFKHGSEVIQRNTDIVQAVNMSVCDHFCLFILKLLTNGEKFQSILNHKVDIHRVIGKILFKPKKGFVVQNIALLGPITHYIYNWIQKIIHYLEMSHIMLLMLFLCTMTSAIEITIIQLENVNVTIKC